MTSSTILRTGVSTTVREEAFIDREVFLYPTNVDLFRGEISPPLHLLNLLSEEEREEMCLEMVGFTTWDQLTKEEKKEAVELEVWKSEAYDKWREDREAKSSQARNSAGSYGGRLR